MKIPPCFYRVSVKAIIVHANKILLCREKNGLWDLPGGGLEFGEDLKQGLRREIQEELNVKITGFENKPPYIWTQQRDNIHCLFIGLRIKVNTLQFQQSEEAVELRFFTRATLQKVKVHKNLLQFKKLF